MATVFPRFKDQILYHRTFIPGKLQLYFKGRSQLWRSLRTADRELAVIRSAQWTTRIHRLFLTLKRQGASMTNAQREELVTRWMDAELDEAEDSRSLHCFDDDQRDMMVDVTVDRLEETEETLSGNRYDRVAADVDGLLQAAGLPLFKHDSLDFKRLCRAFLLAKRDMLTTEIERWQGKYVKNRVSAVPPATPPSYYPQLTR